MARTSLHVLLVILLVVGFRAVAADVSHASAATVTGQAVTSDADAETSEADPAPDADTSEVGPSAQHVGVRVASEFGGALLGGYLGAMAGSALSALACSGLSVACTPVVVLTSVAIVGLTALGGWLPGSFLGGHGSYWGAFNGALLGALVSLAFSVIPFTAFIAPAFVWTFPVIGAVIGLEWSHSKRRQAIAPFIVRGGGGLSLVAQF